MGLYHYTVYGLNIASEIHCPELPTASGQTEVTIRRGSLEHIKLPKENRWRNQVLNDDQMLVNIKDTARYLVSGGREIIVDKNPDAAEESVRLFLLGSAFGAILHQRGFLAIHGNGIVVNGECVVFAGHAGKGKSTLAAAFARRGFQILSDDVCAIKTSNGEKALAYPGFPHVKLWADAADSLDVDWRNLRQVHIDEKKYVLPMDSEYFDTPLSLSKIYVLHFHPHEEFRIQELYTIDKITALKNHTYRAGMVKKMEKSEDHFERCAQVADTTTVARIFRPKDLLLLDPLIDLLMESVE